MVVRVPIVVKFMANSFVFLWDILPANVLECLFISHSHFAEYIIRSCSHCFVPTAQSPSSGRVVKIGLHLVIAQFIHHQDQDFPVVRSTCQIFRQNRSKTAVIVISLQKRQFGLGNSVDMLAWHVCPCSTMGWCAQMSLYDCMMSVSHRTASIVI